MALPLLHNATEDESQAKGEQAEIHTGNSEKDLEKCVLAIHG